MPFFSLSQDAIFACPMKKGKIIIEERGLNEGKRNPGVIIEGRNDKVYSCSSGSITAIDTVNGILRVHIEFNNYFFSYNNLENVKVSTGQLIKKGELIGTVKRGERLFLICSKDNALIEPQSVLNCKIIYRHLD